jgi:predicted small metal-binding protein
LCEHFDHFKTISNHSKLDKIMKTVHCRDLGFDCDGVVKADTENEVLQQVAAHAQTVHGVTVTPELAEQVKTLIKEEA